MYKTTKPSADQNRLFQQPWLFEQKQHLMQSVIKAARFPSVQEGYTNSHTTLITSPILFGSLLDCSRNSTTELGLFLPYEWLQWQDTLALFHQATNPSHSTTSFKDNKQTNQTADCHWFKPSLTEQAIKTNCCSEYLNTSYTSTFVIRKNISQLETLTTKDYKSTKTHKAVSEIFLLQYLK